MIKILFFITDLGIGGAERLLLAILEKLDRKKYYPVVCCFYGGEVLKQIEALNIKVINLKVKNKLDFTFFWKFFFVLKREKPRIIHTHLFHANIVGRLVARLAGVPVVISTQHYSSNFHGYFGILLDRLTAPLTDRIIAVSEAAKMFCVKQEYIEAKKISVVYNGVELDSINRQVNSKELPNQPSLRDGPIIGSAGRFVAIKGFEYLFYAIPEVIVRYPGAKFFILGYGPLKQHLIELANKLHISDKVKFMSPQTEVCEFLSLLDVYVLPSLSEGLSITLLEAMAMEKHIVATNVGGNSEVIIDGETGLLVPAQNPNAISRAIIYLLENKPHAIQMGIRAKKQVENRFNINRMLKDTELIYDSLSAAKK